MEALMKRTDYSSYVDYKRSHSDLYLSKFEKESGASRDEIIRFGSALIIKRDLSKISRKLNDDMIRIILRGIE